MTGLFSPLNIGSLTLPNRVVMAPLTRNRAPDTVATDLLATYYQQRASAGLIITEGAQISPQGVGYPATPGIHSEAQVEGWRKTTSAVHSAGGRIYIQLWHVGRVSHPDFHHGELPVAPSAIAPAGQAFTDEGLKPFVTPRALACDELPGIVTLYRQAALNAMQAGFDGVEIHAANGYLLDQFLRDGSNRRDDDYGGSLENRSRLLLEVTTAVCKAIGSDKVGVRISPVNEFNDMRDSDPQTTFNHVATSLSSLNLAYLHVVEVNMAGESSAACDMRQILDRFAGTYIANGGYDKAHANTAIADGRADAVSFGVPFIANPDLVARFHLDAPLNNADPDTFYGGNEKGYTDYPFLDETE
ncbi:MAG: alkene reductase [Gammaproteobacteria bacterium]|nr:alkene reductase [Gammaproteobacteria bacterium]